MQINLFLPILTSRPLSPSKIKDARRPPVYASSYIIMRRRSKDCRMRRSEEFWCEDKKNENKKYEERGVKNQNHKSIPGLCCATSFSPSLPAALPPSPPAVPCIPPPSWSVPFPQHISTRKTVPCPCPPSFDCSRCEFVGWEGQPAATDCKVCSVCAVGTGRSTEVGANGGCAICGEGYFSDVGDSSECKPCAAGKFITDDGVMISEHETCDARLGQGPTWSQQRLLASPVQPATSPLQPRLRAKLAPRASSSPTTAPLSQST